MPGPARVEWRAHARTDLLNLLAYIAQANPSAAQQLKNDIEAKVARLPDQPALYKASLRVPGLREMVVRRNFIVLYRVPSTCIEIVSVVHARRQWPPAG